MKTSTHYVERAEKLKRQIDSGKFKGQKLKAAKGLYYSLRARSKKAAGKSKSKAKTPKRSYKQARNPGQGFLPTFLSQMNMVRVEELVAEKLFRTILGVETDQKTLKRANDAIAQAVEISFPSDRKQRKGA